LREWDVENEPIFPFSEGIIMPNIYHCLGFQREKGSRRNEMSLVALALVNFEMVSKYVCTRREGVCDWDPTFCH
jgi:hypothetical protein